MFVVRGIDSWKFIFQCLKVVFFSLIYNLDYIGQHENSGEKRKKNSTVKFSLYLYYFRAFTYIRAKHSSKVAILILVKNL